MEKLLLLKCGQYEKELCIDTVKQLRHSGKLPKNAILHSDRGSQYTSMAFREELKKSGLLQSLSGTGHCFDNARMESFFATLKKEKLYKLPLYLMTRAEVKIIRAIATEYVKDIFRRLREYGYDEGTMILYVTGGGGCLVKNFCKFNSERVKFVDDICAAAKGYEYMAELQIAAGN